MQGYEPHVVQAGLGNSAAQRAAGPLPVSARAAGELGEAMHAIARREPDGGHAAHGMAGALRSNPRPRGGPEALRFRHFLRKLRPIAVRHLVQLPPA